jgi:hypothetical protein
MRSIKGWTASHRAPLELFLKESLVVADHCNTLFKNRNDGLASLAELAAFGFQEVLDHSSKRVEII